MLKLMLILSASFLTLLVGGSDCRAVSEKSGPSLFLPATRIHVAGGNHRDVTAKPIAVRRELATSGRIAALQETATALADPIREMKTTDDGLVGAADESMNLLTGETHSAARETALIPVGAQDSVRTPLAAAPRRMTMNQPVVGPRLRAGLREASGQAGRLSLGGFLAAVAVAPIAIVVFTGLLIEWPPFAPFAGMLGMVLPSALIGLVAGEVSTSRRAQNIIQTAVIIAGMAAGYFLGGFGWPVVAGLGIANAVSAILGARILKAQSSVGAAANGRITRVKLPKEREPGWTGSRSG